MLREEPTTNLDYLLSATPFTEAHFSSGFSDFQIVQGQYFVFSIRDDSATPTRSVNVLNLEDASVVTDSLNPFIDAVQAIRDGIGENGTSAVVIDISSSNDFFIF